MAEAIVYCGRCSHIIRPSEIADGLALIGPNAAVCRACSAKLTPDERARILGPVAARTPSGKPSARSAPARRRALAPATWGLILAGAGAGALAAVAMALLSASPAAEVERWLARFPRVKGGLAAAARTSYSSTNPASCSLLS